jgi:hypothetical protein
MAPRIVLTKRAATLICPFCRGELGVSEKKVRCTLCGTAYHDDCGRLHGACGLLGCGGRLAGLLAPTGADVRHLALVLRPRGEPTEAQIDAVRSATGMALYDARLRLRSPIPVVLGYHEEAAIDAACATLEAAGLAPFAVDAREIGAPDAFTVKTVEREGDLLVLTSTDGRADKLDLRDPRRVMRGRYVDMVEENRIDMTYRDGGPTQRTDKRRDRHRHVARHTPFAHVYRGSSEPFVFEADAVRGYGFLGAARTGSATLNFLALADLLAQGADLDTTLERMDGTLTHVRILDGKLVNSNRRWMASVSRLLYHARQLLGA